MLFFQLTKENLIMTSQTDLSSEAQELLKEILAHENEEFYLENRFKVLSKKDDTILRGCFKELNDNEMIKVLWGDNISMSIQILKVRRPTVLSISSVLARSLFTRCPQPTLQILRQMRLNRSSFQSVNDLSAFLPSQQLQFNG